MVSVLVLMLAATPPWPSESMPLQLSVQTPEDLAFKAGAEKQYLVFNLLASGKLAWDKGDFSSAADRWESLLRLPGLAADVDALVRPWAVKARAKAGGQTLAQAPVMDEMPSKSQATQPAAATPTFEVHGTVSGGGQLGPGGAVVFLKRLDGPTPKPRPGTAKVVVQKGKRFNPRVIAVPLGAKVDFRNDDPYDHNVFSLSKPNDFDLGFYKGGVSKTESFDAPGPVQLLCNIHSSMMGWVYVVDTPWFAQADGSGKFSVRGVPAGDYTLTVWHESSSKPTEKKLKVNEQLGEVQLAVDGDRRTPAFVPDKQGNPRQPQLGY